MKFATTTAVAAVLALGLAGAAAPALAKKKEDAQQAQGKAQFSPAFRQAAQPLQAAVQGGDVAAAQAALPAAQQAASTPDDKFNLGIMMFSLGQKTNNQDLQLQGADLSIQSGKAPADTQAQLINAKGVISYNKGDLAGADAAFTQAFQQNPNDGDNAILLAQTKIREKQPQAALPIIDKAIQAKKASGQPVPQDWYQRALAVSYDAKDAVGTVKYGQMLVAAYPSTTTWRTAVQTYRDVGALDQQSQLDALRLMRAAGALAGERDYYEYANLANDRGYPAEAKAVIDEGMASSMVDKAAVAVRNSKALGEIKRIATPKIAADKASLPAQDKAARAAGDGKKALNVGDAYLGYGMYPQAAELFKLAAQKGGVDATVANLRLGEALARSGQKDAADQALASVTGPRQPLAQYWTIWNDQGAKPASAAAAQAPAAAPAQ
ncbi:hypothetical protein [Sphingomonas sp.]|uniref:hypothetical protein n=1 Tax=Sphingomonas sp. TaxID=28214 RepID=UPI003B0001FE